MRLEANGDGISVWARCTTSSPVALPVRLEQHREVPEPLHHLHQVLRPDPQQPERSAPIRAPARQEQRARRVLAEQGPEERRDLQLPKEQLVDLPRAGKLGHELDGRILLAPGEPDHEPVVVGERLHLDVQRVADPGPGDQEPGVVDPPAERRVHDDAMVAELVQEVLDHDDPVARQLPQRFPELEQVRPQVERRPRVQAAPVPHPLHELRLVDPELVGTAGKVAVPERHPGQRAGSLRDDDLVLVHGLDAPDRGPEDERVPKP